MTTPLALALDIGTTSLSAIALDEQGGIAGLVHEPNDSAVGGLPAGHAEQDPSRLRAAAFRALRQLAALAPGEPVCLGLTGQMHGILLSDERRRPLTNLITWQDRRANERPEGGEANYLQQYLARCSEAALSRSGCRLSPGYGAVTLFVLAQQGRLPAKAHRAAFLADWIAAELTETPLVTDRTNAASAGVFDLERDEWSGELIDAAGPAGAGGRIDRDLFPPVRESGTIVGPLSPAAAQQTGLPEGLPVCLAIGDNQAAVLGSVPAGVGNIQINIGTGGQINWAVDRFLRVDAMDTRPLPFGRFLLVGAGLAGGDAYAWVQRTAADWLEALGCEASPERIYETMNAAARRLPADVDGLTCEPLFRGTRRQPQARGSLRGIGTENFTLGHLARAVLQGIADGMVWFYEHAGEARPASGPDAPPIIGSGNGLRKNPLLVAILEATFGRPVLLPVHREEAAYGAALLAGASVRLWPDLETASRLIRLRPGRGEGGNG